MSRPLTLSTEERAAQRALITAECWRRGELRYLMHRDQRRVYDAWRASQGRYVMEIARKWGKTWLLVLIAFMTCLRKPRARVVYGAPTLKHLAEFILPVIEDISAHAPAEFRPIFSPARGHVLFPNGSYIHLFGADDKRKADRGRGPKAELAIFDEAGFTPILRYVLRAVFRPSLLPTGGRVLLGSTPAAEPDHDFTGMAEKAEINETYASASIWDCPLYSREQVERFIAEDARDEAMSPEAYQDTDDFKREYLAQRVVDRLLVVVPEWLDKRKELIRAVERPAFFDALTWIDPGGNDPHAALFAYWHFPLAVVVVEDELLLKGGANTTVLAEAIKEKEKALWGTDAWEGTLRAAHDAEYQLMRDSLPDWMADAADEAAPTQPYARWTDNNLQFARDMYELHGIVAVPTAKDNKELQINNLRVLIQAGQYVVHPRCVHHDRHLRTTTWKDSKRLTYRRIAGEHGDTLDCGVYGIRNLNRRNPFPSDWGVTSHRELALLRAAEAKKPGLHGTSALARKLAKR